MSLNSKNILFIGRNFFGYDKIIAESLRNKGAIVDYVADVPYKNNISKSILRVARPLIINDSQNRILKKIESFNRASYDFVFVIIGEGLNERSLRVLRYGFPNAKFVLHIWDAIDNNRESLVSNFKFFERVSSFDKGDSLKHNLHFRPLFYSPQYDLGNTHQAVPVFDACFIGTAHSDRSVFIYKISQQLSLQGRSFYIFQYLQARWLYYVYNLYDGRFKEAPIAQFSFSPMPQVEVAEVVNSSMVVIDIPHKRQNGLTIRTLEALGAGKKLATTNSTIAEYDFYHPNNICILDRENPIIPESFFSCPYVEIPKEIKQNYTLDLWLEEVLGL